MKKIILFINGLSSGGAEHQLSLLSSFLAEKGYNIEISTYSDIPDYYPLCNQIKRTNIGKGRSFVVKLLLIFSYFLKTKADVVISFGSRNNTLAILPLLFRPHIKILAGERCANFMGLSWYKRLNFRLLYKRANYIVPNSYTQRNEIISYQRLLENKIRVITNYTDLDLYKVQPFQNNDIIQIGIFARYAIQKNYVRFAKVIKLLKDCTKKQFMVTWFGNKSSKESSNPDYEHFEELIKYYNISDVIALKDHVQNVSSIIPEFDVLCLPSLGEGFSNSISEYICCGRPVLCSNVADNSIMVKDGLNGFLFDPTDEENMKESFLKFFDLTKEEIQRMGEISRQIAESLFNKDSFVNSYIDLIETL